jgi:hypothetical protein
MHRGPSQRNRPVDDVREFRVNLHIDDRDQSRG